MKLLWPFFVYRPATWGRTSLQNYCGSFDGVLLSFFSACDRKAPKPRSSQFLNLEQVMPRDGKPQIYPYFQAFARLFVDTESGSMAVHYAKPLLGTSQLLGFT